MRNLKNVTNEEPQYYKTYYVSDGECIEKINYDKETNVVSFDLDSFPFSGTGVYWKVTNLYDYEPFITKPTNGEWATNFTPVEFNTPDGQTFSGYYRDNGIYSSTSSSTIGYFSEFSILTLPKYGEYQYFINKYFTTNDFSYTEYANDSIGQFVDGPGLYCCNSNGSIASSDSSCWGKYTIGEQVNAYSDKTGTYQLITANIITNSRGQQEYYADVYGNGIPYICYSARTYDNLPVLNNYSYTLQEKTPSVANYYESDIRPGVTYNREEGNVLYNNQNKNLYFEDPDFTTTNRDISSMTFNELGITVDTIEKYVELLENEYYPADWFNIRINGNKFTSAFYSYNNRLLRFSFRDYRVSFDLNNETCVFDYYVPGPK